MLGLPVGLEFFEMEDVHAPLLPGLGVVHDEERENEYSIEQVGILQNLQRRTVRCNTSDRCFWSKPNLK